MNLIPKRSVSAIMAAAVGVFTLTAVLSQKPVAAQTSDQKVEDVFKNIKSFRGQPADMLNPTMVFFEASLGVGCPFCHDPDANKRELDNKPQKLIARQMIDMVNSVNKTTFNGAKQVTCFTCHQGRSTPIGIPNVTNSNLPPALGEDYIASLPPPPAVPAVNAAQVLDKYFAAVGGAAAVQKTPSLTGVGTIEQRRPGKQYPAQEIEVDSKAGGKGLVVTKAGQNNNLLAYGANGGWAKAGNGDSRDLRKAEADGAMLEDPFNLPAQLKQVLIDAKMDRPENIRGREVYVVTGHTKNLPLVKVYFEKETGMIDRLIYFNDTLFGHYPTQIDYGDFRDVGGRKVPYQWVISQTRNREYTYAMQAVRATPVDDAKFVKPGPGSR